MWVVYEMEDRIVDAELKAVIGPFETREAAEIYAMQYGYEVIELEPPDDV